MSEGNLYKIDNCMQNETHHKYMPKNNTSSELESEISINNQMEQMVLQPIVFNYGKSVRIGGYSLGEYY